MPRLRLHEAFQFLSSLTKQTKTKASWKKIEIYSKYDVAGRLQNGSSGIPKIRIEKVSQDLEVDSPKKTGQRTNGRNDTALKKKATVANIQTKAAGTKLNKSVDEQREGDNVRSMSGGNGKRRQAKFQKTT